MLIIRSAFDQAQIKIFVIDIGSEDSILAGVKLYKNITSNVISSNYGNVPSLVICNKADLLSEQAAHQFKIRLMSELKSISDHDVTDNAPKVFFTSCINNQGIDVLEQGISERIKNMVLRSDQPNQYEGALITRERHRNHVKQCLQHLERFLTLPLPMDAAAEEIR